MKDAWHVFRALAIATAAVLLIDRTARAFRSLSNRKP